MLDVVVALDWTPNTNHLGFFVAQEKGYYTDAGLNVTFVSPESDGYQTTPRKRVETGVATFGICPSESVISCHSVAEGKTGTELVAVAALLQAQTSAIVTLKTSGITSPKMLDGKNYASYQGRFEMDIIQQMVIMDGGKGEVKEVLPGQHGLGIFNTMLANPDMYDATWVFMPWEGVIARQKGVELNVFSLENVPYGYTPVLVCTPEAIKNDSEKLAKFLKATAQGYKDAVADGAGATEILIKQAKHVGIELTPEMVAESVKELSPSFLNAQGEWGKMELSRWAGFTKWLGAKGLIKTRDGAVLSAPDPAKLFSNDLLP